MLRLLSVIAMPQIHVKLDGVIRWLLPVLSDKFKSVFYTPVTLTPTHLPTTFIRSWYGLLTPLWASLKLRVYRCSLLIIWKDNILRPTQLHEFVIRWELNNIVTVAQYQRKTIKIMEIQIPTYIIKISALDHPILFKHSSHRAIPLNSWFGLILL